MKATGLQEYSGQMEHFILQYKYVKYIFKFVLIAAKGPKCHVNLAPAAIYSTTEYFYFY